MVEEVLKTGQRNALSPEYLAKRLNLGTVRALQKQVEKERREGAVILSTSIPPGGFTAIIFFMLSVFVKTIFAVKNTVRYIQMMIYYFALANPV